MTDKVEVIRIVKLWGKYYIKLNLDKIDRNALAIAQAMLGLLVAAKDKGRNLDIMIPIPDKVATLMMSLNHADNRMMKTDQTGGENDEKA